MFSLGAANLSWSDTCELQTFVLFLYVYPLKRGVPMGVSGQDWNFLDFVVVRVEMEDGTVGWGDAFAYNCRAAVHATVREMIAPVVIGRDASGISEIGRDQGL